MVTAGTSSRRNGNGDQFAYLGAAAARDSSICREGSVNVNYLRNPSKLSNPFCALNLLGSYSWMRSFARAGFAYGYRISFSLGSRCVLLRKSTSWVVDIILRLDVPTLQG